MDHYPVSRQSHLGRFGDMAERRIGTATGSIVAMDGHVPFLRFACIVLFFAGMHARCHSKEDHRAEHSPQSVFKIKHDIVVSLLSCIAPYIIYNV